MRRYADLWARIRANSFENSAGCWIWTAGVGTNHRPQMAIRREGKHCTCNVARVVLLQFYLPGPWEASHVCDDDTWLCVRPDHIIPETKKQNMARRWGKPLPPGIDWPRVPGSPPVWRPPEIDLDAGIVSEVCPF